jgi:hypothetical protein
MTIEVEMLENNIWIGLWTHLARDNVAVVS